MSDKNINTRIHFGEMKLGHYKEWADVRTKFVATAESLELFDAIRRRAVVAFQANTELVLSAEEFRRIMLDSLANTPAEHVQEVKDAIIHPEQSSLILFGCKVTIKD